MLLLRGWPTGSLTGYQLIARRTIPSSSSQGCASRLRAAKRLFETVDGCTERGKSCRFARAFLLEVLGPVSWCGALQFAPGAESFFGSSFSLFDWLRLENLCIDWTSHWKSGLLVIGSAVEDLDLRSVAVFPLKIFALAVRACAVVLLICSSRFAR